MIDAALSRAQRELIRAFFWLGESAGFLLAGGAALIASGISNRPTQDVDLFHGGLLEDLSATVTAFETQFELRGWKAIRVRAVPTFFRPRVEIEDEGVIVDIAVDSAPVIPVQETEAGPT